MNTINPFELKKARDEIERLEKLLGELDKVATILYNNMEHSGIWNLLKQIEELRFDYMMKHQENSETIQNKGNTNE